MEKRGIKEIGGRKQKRRGGKRILFRAALLLSAALFIGGASASAFESGIYTKLLRLHVLAASDAPEDQALKLEVRDAILDAAAPYLEGCRSAEEAEKSLDGNREVLLTAARERLAAAGCGDGVEMSFSDEYYPTRQYENVSLPAGRYRSLQVKIGEAEGKNWWCVLYPPLCLSASRPAEKGEGDGDEEALLQAGLTKEETAVLTGNSEGNGRFTLRFRFLELFGELRRALGF